MKIMRSFKEIICVLLISHVSLFFVADCSNNKGSSCTCQDQSHCDYVSSWDSNTKEVIVTTSDKEDKNSYEKWLWDSISTVLVLNDHIHEPLMCYTHSMGKKYGLMLDVQDTKNITEQQQFAERLAVDAENQRADVLALNFMELIGNCGNAERHVDDIINIAKTVIPGVKTRNTNLKVLCVLPWQPPCYNSNCNIGPVMSTLCDALILNVDSFDTYCDEACIAKALMPFTKVMIALQEYTAIGFNVSQFLLSIPWHGYKYTCTELDILPSLGHKPVCHLNKMSMKGGPDKCQYQSVRERVDLPTLFSEHPHLAFDEAKYSRPDQAPFYYKYDANESYMIWYEDIGSLTAKYKLVNDYNLKGLVIFTAEDLTYGSMPAKDKFNTNMWSWLLHTVLVPASTGAEESSDLNYAGTIAGLGVGMFLFGCLMGALIACVIFRRKRTLHAPFHQDKSLDTETDEFHDDDHGL